MNRKEKREIIYDIKSVCPESLALPNHILPVRDVSPKLALSKIFEIVHGDGGRCNAAIWFTPPKTGIKSRIEVLEEWCGRKGLILSGTTTSADNNFRSLRKAFNKVSSDPALSILQDHVFHRLKMFADVYPGQDVHVSINASPYMKIANAGGNAHVDGGAVRMDRFIEALSGTAVCLVDNKQVDFGAGFHRIKLKDDDVRLWQPPVGALVMLTSYMNAPKPIMHVPPPPSRRADDKDFGQKKPQRIVITYDLIKPA